MGIACEITYFHPDIEMRNRNGWVEGRSPEKVDIFCQKVKEMSMVDDCHTDSYSVEISSEVFDTPNKLYNWFKRMDKSMKTKGLYPYHKDFDGGGLHFHIDYPKDVDFLKFYKGMTNFNSNFPYLNWIFNNPVDNENANNIMLKTLKSKKIPRFSMSSIHKEFSHTLFDYGIEWRIFEMARNEKEFKLMLDFIVKLHIVVCTNRTEIYNRKITEYYNIYACIRDFCNLLHSLDLNPADYEIFIDRNLYTRFSYGRRYLI